MITVIYGDDRLSAEKFIKSTLGQNYEVLEGENIDLSSLSEIFNGLSLFADTRNILIKDLSENKSIFEKISTFTDTPHKVIIWEQKLDKRSSIYKSLSTAKIEAKEFKLPVKIDRNLAFNIYDTALHDGKKAAEMLKKAEETEDPYQLLGAWSWKAIDNYKRRSGEKEKRVLRELSDLDIKMKSTPFSPWLLLQSFLLRLSSL